MKKFTHASLLSLPFLAALSLSCGIQPASFAQSSPGNVINSRPLSGGALSHAAVSRRVANSQYSLTQWPQRDPENGGEPIGGSYTHRLNQLVMDDNIRSLRRSVHSDFARNTPSFKRLESLVARLSDRNGREKDRWEAAQALGDTKHVVGVLAVPALSQALHGDPDLTVRNYAALALLKLDLRVAVPQLLHGLESCDSDTRQLSASALHTASATAVGELTKLVRCPDPYMKRLGCLGLAEIGAPAFHSVVALRQASSDSDVDGLFSKLAAQTAECIEKDWQASRNTGDMPFDADMWKGDDRGLYRRAMLNTVLSQQFLLGRSADQVQNLLGEGLSFNDGTELRYSVGTVELSQTATKNRSQSSAWIAGKDLNGKDLWLVVALAKGIVTDCQVKAFSQSDWNVNHQDNLIEAMANTDPRL